MLHQSQESGQARRPCPVSRASAGGTSDGSSRPARILVVEDDYLVALALECHLVEEGFEVVGIAGTAEEALEIAASEKPALAIMDIRLAGSRDGVDAAIDLFSKLGVPSIFASAYADSTIQQRAEQAKPLGWLQKPYSLESLITLVKKALAQDE